MRSKNIVGLRKYYLVRHGCIKADKAGTIFGGSELWV